MLTLVAAGYALALVGTFHVTACNNPDVVYRPLAGRSPMLTTYLLRRDGEPGQAYCTTTDDADLAVFEERGREEQHQCRFIVSLEDAAELEDLRRYTRDLMARMEADLGTRLEWWASDAKAESTLRAMGERGDIIRTMQHAMSGKARELAVF